MSFCSTDMEMTPQIKMPKTCSKLVLYKVYREMRRVATVPKFKHMNAVMTDGLATIGC